MPQLKYGTLSLAPADNLASNLLGGFKEGSTAYRGCRHCLATPPEIASVFTESQLELRSAADHLAKCDKLENAVTQAKFMKRSKKYGINHRSILNELLYFDVCSGALVPDVMHDVLEGTSHLHVVRVLIILIVDRYSGVRSERAFATTHTAGVALHFRIP